jgi:hypothetical protein
MPNKTRHLGNGEGVGETLFDFAMTRKSGVKFNHKEPAVESSVRSFDQRSKQPKSRRLAGILLIL